MLKLLKYVMFEVKLTNDDGDDDGDDDGGDYMTMI